MRVMNAGVLGGVSLNKAFPRGNLFFGEGMNPNDVFRGTTWARVAQGRALVGVDESDADYNAARKSGGAKTVALATNQLGSHNHAFTGTAVHSDTSVHTHHLNIGANIIWDQGSGYNYNSPALPTGSTLQATGLMSTEGVHSHATGVSAASALAHTGGGGAHNNLQPYVVCEIWERTDGATIPAGYTGSGLPGLDKLFPVGALLYAMTDVQPNALYGGTWTRIKGRCVVLVNESDADFSAALKTGGAKTHALTLAQTPAHSHTPTFAPIASSLAGEHAHTIKVRLCGWGSVWDVNGTTPHAGHLTSASHYHTVTFTGSIAYTGGGAAHENRQPYLTCYLWYRSA